MGKVTTLVLTALALAGCAGSNAAGVCRPTVPGTETAKGFNYGSDGLAVELWPRGVLVAGPLPDGGSYAQIKPDGSIVTKLGWWRGAAGPLTITGNRTDATAPPLRADIPDGYGPTGFQATGITFASAGCWRVLGRVGSERLQFVVRVRKLGELSGDAHPPRDLPVALPERHLAR